MTPPVIAVVFRGAFVRVQFAESGMGESLWWFHDGPRTDDLTDAEWLAIEGQVEHEIAGRRAEWNARRDFSRIPTGPMPGPGNAA